MRFYESMLLKEHKHKTEDLDESKDPFEKELDIEEHEILFLRMLSALAAVGDFAHFKGLIIKYYPFSDAESTSFFRANVLRMRSLSTLFSMLSE